MWTNVLNEYKKNLVKYFRKFGNIFRVETTYIQDDNNVSIFHHISKIMISIISRNLCVYCCWFPRLLQLVIHLFSTTAIIDVSIVLNWFNVLRHYISGWIHGPNFNRSINTRAAPIVSCHNLINLLFVFKSVKVIW